MVSGRRPGAPGMVKAPRPIPISRSRDTGPRVRPWLVGVRVGQCRLGQDPCAGAARDPAVAQQCTAGKDPLHHLHQGGRGQHGGAGIFHAWPLGHARRRCARCGDPRSRACEFECTLRMRARELFACALETPGGLKVQTIHALCTRLLQQFPFEANVPARFAVLDERDQTEMMERANLAVFLDAAHEPDSAVGPRAQHRDGERRRRHFQGRGARGVPEPRLFHGMERQCRQRRSRGRASVGGARRRCRRSYRGRRTRDRRWAASTAIALDGHRARFGYGQQVRRGAGCALSRGRGFRRRCAGGRLSRRLPDRSRPHAPQIDRDEEFRRQSIRRWRGRSSRRCFASAR